MELNIYSIAYPVTSLGPGNRIVLWLTGCRKRCIGCISQNMQEHTSGRKIAVQKLLKYFLRLNHNLVGITISGGEPFEQAAPLAELLRGIVEYRPKWNILVYSGYKLSEVLRNTEESDQFMTIIDVLVDGDYQMDLPSKHSLTGSGNQKIHYLTKRGRAMNLQIDAIAHNKVNVGFAASREHMLIGILNPEMRNLIHECFELRMNSE